jgi:hypothetical protein
MRLKAHTAAGHPLFMPLITPPLFCFSPPLPYSPERSVFHVHAREFATSARRAAKTASARQQRYWKRTPAAGIDRQYERRIVRNSLLSILEGVG